jgi:integrase
MKTLKKPEIIAMLDKENSHLDRIRIRARAKYNKDKQLIGYTTYLDLSKNKVRELEYLPKDLHFDGLKSSLKSDKDKLRHIVAYRNKKQNELLKDKTGFSLRTEVRYDLISYFEKNLKDGLYICAFKQLKAYIGSKSIMITDIDYKFCNGFAEYLSKSVLSQNSGYIYLGKLKAILNKAVREEIIQVSPARNVTIPYVNPKREFLTEEEIIILANAKIPNSDTYNAFLFSCFSGLRYSDIKKLKYSDIKEGYIDFKQQKTGENLRMKLSVPALKCIEKQRELISNEYIFNLSALPNIEKHLKKWTASAGINKHITFHCARHTFATLSLSKDIDIFTVSKLLGHKDLKTTQIYAQLIDKKKDQAIDKLSDIDI